jgi:hypothetical protein
MDILSDDTGVNFHRFQMVAWTLVLGVIFVRDVYATLAMPIFDGSLFGLLGWNQGASRRRSRDFVLLAFAREGLHARRES